MQEYQANDPGSEKNACAWGKVFSGPRHLPCQSSPPTLILDTAISLHCKRADPASIRKVLKGGTIQVRKERPTLHSLTPNRLSKTHERATLARAETVSESLCSDWLHTSRPLLVRAVTNLANAVSHAILVPNVFRAG